MTETTPINWRKAAESARQIARPFMDMQSLVAALDDLASQENAANELRRTVAALKDETNQQASARDTAKATAEQAAAAASAEVAAELTRARQALADVHAQIESARQQRDTTLAAVSEGEARLAKLRESLASVTRAVA